jgi:hypothetical protein
MNKGKWSDFEHLSSRVHLNQKLGVLWLPWMWLGLMPIDIPCQLCMCEDKFGSHLQWKKRGSWEGSSKLGVSAFKKLTCTIFISFKFLYLPCLSQLANPIMHTTNPNAKCQITQSVSLNTIYLMCDLLELLHRCIWIRQDIEGILQWLERQSNVWRCILSLVCQA